MPILELNFNRAAEPGETVVYRPTQPAVAAVVDGHTATLPSGVAANDYADTAAESICVAVNAALGLSGENAYAPRPSYAPTTEETAAIEARRRPLPLTVGPTTGEGLPQLAARCALLEAKCNRFLALLVAAGVTGEEEDSS